MKGKTLLVFVAIAILSTAMFFTLINITPIEQAAWTGSITIQIEGGNQIYIKDGNIKIINYKRDNNVLGLYNNKDIKIKISKEDNIIFETITK